MNIYAEIKTEIIKAVAAVLDAQAASNPNITVEPPKDAAHGDMASNAAMVLARDAKMKPRDLAEKIAGELGKKGGIEAVEIAGPGFLNIRLKSDYIQNLVGAVLKKGADFGRGKPDGEFGGEFESPRKVNVEYVSANPTGPLHAGHMRGAVVGDALAGLLDFAGYEVTREYYINDGGAQVDVLARSIYLRYLEAHGRKVEFADGTYPGDYLIAIGQDFAKRYGDQYVDQDEAKWLALFREEGTEAMMDLIRADLAALGVKMDVFYSEKSLYDGGQIEAAIDELTGKGLIYEGTLPPPKGKELEDWEAREQTLFKSTEHGDDVDRPIKKADGSWTYFAPDIAYHYDKISRGFDELIDILGADHGGYVKRMQAAVSALSDGKVPLDIRLCQMVKLFKNGEPFKMSKRAGNFVLLSDIVEEVGADVARFVVLMRKSDAPLDFDFDKVREQSKDNPVFYVQYAHARAGSVLKKGAAAFGDLDLSGATLSKLRHAAELALIKNMANFPRLVSSAAEIREPHRIAFYLYDLASEFHALQHMGKLDEKMRFIQEGDPELSMARLALVRALKQVIANGLQILGVSPIEDM